MVDIGRLRGAVVGRLLTTLFRPEGSPAESKLYRIRRAPR